MADFAEPYAARVIATMLGIPENEWPVIARDSATLGLARGVRIREDLPGIKAALGRLDTMCAATGLATDSSRTKWTIRAQE